MKKIIAITTTIILLGTSGGVVLAERIDQTQFEKIVSEAINKNSNISQDQQVIQEKSQEIRDVEERIDTINEKLYTLAEEETTLENYIDGISTRMEKNAETIDRTKKEIDVIQLEIEVLGREIDDAQKEIDKKNEALSSVIQEMYIRDQLTPLEITVGSDSLSGFFSQAKYDDDVRSEIDELIGELKHDKQLLEEKRNEQTQKKADLATAKHNLDAEQYTLKEDQNFKEELLEDTQNSEKKFQEILKNAREEEARLSEEISTLQRQTQEEIDSIRSDVEQKLAADPNVELTGREKLAITDNVQFIWPVTGPITCEFQCAGYPFEYAFGAHTGTDIGIPHDTAVAAAATGEVTQVSYPVSPDLAYVVITHGADFSTAYLHLSEIHVSLGDFVEQGDIIGLSGGTYGTNGAGASTGPHLHFEIRKDGLPVNAEDYLP